MLFLPPPISPGDTLGLVAPAGPVDPASLTRAIDVLEAAGFAVKTYRPLDARVDYLAGTDEQRAAELNAALADTETTALLPIRGGYGVTRILHHVDFSPLKMRPKLMCGFSDITALHLAFARVGLATLHGPNLQDGLGQDEPLGETAEAAYWFWLAGVGDYPKLQATLAAEGCRVLSPGACAGPVLGGNLAVFCGLIGTPYQPALEGAILFIEDVGEAPYRVDRYLSQLQLAGVFDRLAGVVLGHFTECGTDGELERVFGRYLAALGKPVLANFPAGHVASNCAFPLGVTALLDTELATLDFSASQSAVGARCLPRN